MKVHLHPRWDMRQPRTCEGHPGICEGHPSGSSSDTHMRNGAESISHQGLTECLHWSHIPCWSDQIVGSGWALLVTTRNSWLWHDKHTNTLSSLTIMLTVTNTVHRHSQVKQQFPICVTSIYGTIQLSFDMNTGIFHITSRTKAFQISSFSWTLFQNVQNILFKFGHDVRKMSYQMTTQIITMSYSICLCKITLYFNLEWSC